MLALPSVRTKVFSIRLLERTGFCKSGQPGQKLIAAGIGRLDAEGHLPEAEFGEFLAVAQLVDVDRRKKVTTASVSPRHTICQRCGTRSRSPNQANSGRQ